MAKARLDEIAEDPQPRTASLSDITEEPNAGSVTGNAQANAGAVVNPKDPAKGRLPNGEQAAAIAAENARVTANAIAGATLPTPLPYDLQQPAQQLAESPTFTNPRTGRTSHRAPMGTVPVLDSPITGSTEIADGSAQMTRPGLDAKLEGAHQILSGGMTLADPMLAAGAVVNPLSTAKVLGSAMAAQTATTKGLQMAGAPQGAADLAGDVTGLIAGGIAHGKGTKKAAALPAGEAKTLSLSEIAGPAKPGEIPITETPDYDMDTRPKPDVAEQASREPASITEPAKPSPVTSPLKVEDIAKVVEPEKTASAELKPATQKDIEGARRKVQESGLPSYQPSEDDPRPRFDLAPDELTPTDKPPADDKVWQKRTDALVDRFRGLTRAGENPPAVEAEYKNGRFEIMDGHHRTLAAQAEGKAVRTVVVNLDDVPADKRAGLGLDKPVETEPPTPAPAERPPVVPPVYGRDVTVNVPGEKTTYPAKYAIREAADVAPSHNPFSFEKNPAYEHVNDRDYSQAGNAARVVENAQNFNPDFHLTDAPTAEQGPTVIDQRGNALGGNNRAMTLKRVYSYTPEQAEAYRSSLREKASQFGIDPQQVGRFREPMLVRELSDPIQNGTAQKAITDFNKTSAAALSPAEQAISDGKRLSSRTVQDLNGRIADLGPESTLRGALKGDDGKDILQSLVKDGAITEQEKHGYLDERGHLTEDAKDRISKALVGRMFETPAQFEQTPPEMRGKLERIAPQVMRVEGRDEWGITKQVREAVAALSEAKAHGIKNLDDLAGQTNLLEAKREYSPEAIAIAKTLQQNPNAAAKAFRAYANDEHLSRDGSQAGFFDPPTREEAFQDAFGKNKGELGASPMLSDVLNHVGRDLGILEDGPRAHFSRVGAAQDRYVRNLSELQRAAPGRPHEAAVRAASSDAVGAALTRAAVPQIQKALGEKIPVAEFFRALAQSRLHGVAERWDAFGRRAETMPESALLKAFGDGWQAFGPAPVGGSRPSPSTGGKRSTILNYLQSLEGRAGMPDDLAQTAAALRGKGDVEGLRNFLGDTFARAADRVAELMPRAEFDALTKRPEFQKGLATYKQVLEQPMATSHALNEGVFSQALGPLDTYFPLVPKEVEKPGTLGKPTPFAKPKNMQNEMATGLADSYDADTAGLKRMLQRALWANSKAGMFNEFEHAGLMRTLDEGERAPDSFPYKGIPYQADTVEVRGPRQIVKDGQVKNEGAVFAVLPRWLKTEIDPIANRQRQPDAGVLRRLVDKANTLAISGPADLVFHTSNLTSALVSNTPFLGKSLADKAMSVPIAKRFAAIAKIALVDPMDSRAATDIREMASGGMLPDRYGSVTYSPKLAQITGADRVRVSTSPILYGPKGIDIRARLVMYRLAKDLNPGATPAELRPFVNQLGNYNRALQGTIERDVKAWGLSPFYTAGSTMLRNGLNAWTGAGPMPASGPGLRIAQQLTGGGVATVGLWMAAYKAYTGKWPQDDKRSKLFQIPANPEDRRSKLGRALWGTGPETGYINFSFINPLAARGARAMGLPGAYETKVLGGSNGQALEAGQRDMMNAWAHPFLGPVPRAAFTASTGNSPYLTGLRDNRGQLSPQFWNEAGKAKPGLPSVEARGKAAAKQLNAFYGQLGEAGGLLATDNATKGNRWARMVVDLVAPGLVGRASNPYGKANYLRKQRQAAGQ